MIMELEEMGEHTYYQIAEEISPLRPVNPECRSEDVDGGTTLVPQDLRLGLDGTVSKSNLEHEQKQFFF